jgi:hypothetical protein
MNHKTAYFLTRIAAVILLSGTFTTPAAAQNSPPKNYFRSPVDYAISLSGSFGEVRRNHFHSGLDIRTDGVTGKPVHAAADGYVSRINISPYGFGKTIYITHPNGYTTVYAHLSAYVGAIAKWARDQQYRQESFALDVEVPAGTLPVKKGDLIAYTGNSGASGGPHLHFEIRDAATQDPMDPLEFGIRISDRTDPRIRSVRIMPHGFNSMVNFSDKAVMLPVTESNGKCSIKQTDTVIVSGNILFGIEAFDLQDGNSMKKGVHSIALYIDGEKRFGYVMERFPFSDTRYVNSVLDYPFTVATDRRVIRAYVAPNNKLREVYHDVVNNGVANFSSPGVHQVKFVVSDVYGNSSEVSFAMKSSPPANVRGRINPATTASGTWMLCTENNKFSNDDLTLEIPEGALYEDLDFLYSASDLVRGSFAPVHHLQNEYTPLQSFCDLYIRATGMPKALQLKALIVRVSDNGRWSTAGGTYENGFVKTRIREFGNYTITVDTIAPLIRPFNIYAGKNIARQGTVSLRISDALSGIKTYRGTLNGQWILMDYDAKRDMLTYKFDDRIKPGKNAFRLVVTDNCGNKSEYSTTLVR